MKIVLVVVLVLCFAQTAFAGNVSQAGFTYTPVTKTYSTTAKGTISGRLVWEPANGKHIVLMGVMASTANTALFDLETDIALDGSGNVRSATKVVPTTHLASSGIMVIGNGTPIWQGTDSGDKLYYGSQQVTGCYRGHSVLLWGYEAGN